MGGVDCADQLRQYYNVNRWSRKWWHRLFWGMVDIAFVNSFVIYNYLNANEKKTLLDYRREVAQGLIIKKQKIIQAKRKRSTEKQPNTSWMTLQPKRGPNSWSVINDVRLGNRGTHFVEFGEKRGRCEVCSINQVESRPHSFYSMCKVFMCCNEKKNCFKIFHEFL